MAIKGTKRKKTIDGKVEEVYIVEFNNGTYKQLKDLLAFLKCEGVGAEKLEDVISLGVAWLERIKKDKESRNKDSEKKV